MKGSLVVTLAENVNVRDVLRDRSSFGAEEVEQLQQAIVNQQIQEVREEISTLKAEIDSSAGAAKNDLLRLGIGLYLLGQHKAAHDYLSAVTDSAMGSFYHALALASLDRHAEAEKKFQAAGQLGHDLIECILRRAGAIRVQGRLQEAESILRSAATKGATRAEYSYQMGCILSDRGDTYGAVEYFERAVDMDPENSRALFSLASEHSLRGNDEEAVRLYERSLAKPPQYVGALLNLGLLYEDMGNYSAAAYCFRQILKDDPNHPQALLYLKDIEATSGMYYDEDSVREEARMQQLLSRPITDFELTVRSRNCLESIQINNLDALTKVTEQELLAGKNFGETSLKEVRELMDVHGLTVGQNVAATTTQAQAFRQTDVSPEERELLDRPVSDLDLSVRARKCMARLGITQLAELVCRTADELLGSKNFGVTSLNEVRAKLADIDLKLRND